jgi:hypothetical protein
MLVTRAARRFWVGLIALGISGCDNHPGAGTTGSAPATDPKVDVAADKAAEQKKAQEIREVIRNPSAFLQPSSMATSDNSTVNRDNRLTRVAVLNRSHFAVNNLQGSVEWIGPNGAALGLTSFNLVGSLAAGETKVYSTADHSLTSTTLQGPAGTIRVMFTHVDVIE